MDGETLAEREYEEAIRVSLQEASAQQARVQLPWSQSGTPQVPAAYQAPRWQQTATAYPSHAAEQPRVVVTATAAASSSRALPAVQLNVRRVETARLAVAQGYPIQHPSRAAPDVVRRVQVATEPVPEVHHPTQQIVRRVQVAEAHPSQAPLVQQAGLEGFRVRGAAAAEPAGSSIDERRRLATRAEQDEAERKLREDAERKLREAEQLAAAAAAVGPAGAGATPPEMLGAAAGSLARVSKLGGLAEKVVPKESAKVVNGGFYETLGVLLMRRGESMESAMMQNIPVGAVVQVLEVGNGRRIKVRDESGSEGWVSVCKADGRQLLLPKLASPEPPLPGGFRRGQVVFWIRFSVGQEYDSNYGSEGLCHGRAQDVALADECVRAEFAWGTGDFPIRWLSRDPPAAAPGSTGGASQQPKPNAPEAKASTAAAAAAASPPPVARPRGAAAEDAAPRDAEAAAREAEVRASASRSVLPKVKQAAKLGMLTLRECGLLELPAEATAGEELSKKLRSADLCRNQLSRLPEAIGTWSSVRTLNCSNNCLMALPDSIGQLSKLQKLELSGNCLATLPGNIRQLGSLRELRLDGNGLQGSAPDVFDGSVADSLEELDLSENRLTGLSPSLCRLKKLGRLLLRDNQLAELPEALGQLERLHHLDVATNRLSVVPSQVLELPALALLWLAQNPIDRQALQESPSLEGFLRRREARINNILLSKVGPITIDLRVCGLDG